MLCRKVNLCRLCENYPDFVKQWESWGQWSVCTVTCGKGVQERTRECESPKFWLCEGRSSDRRLCSETPCPSKSKSKESVKVAFKSNYNSLFTS